MTPVKIYSAAELARVEGDGLSLTISSRVSGVDNTHKPHPRVSNFSRFHRVWT